VSGACHLRGYTVASEVLGIPVKTDPLVADGKASLVKAFQDATAAFDAAGICIFTSFAWGLSDVQPQVAAACGEEFTLDRLNEIGVEISIDDFGTGYSSLAYLTTLPISELKIDRSFVRDLGITPQSSAVVTAIIALARSLGLRVIAEGVENLRQMEVLHRLGCGVMQGFLFSRPIPPDDLERFRVECFDISHTAGESTQASCVVFEAHKMQSAQYRRYNIEGVTGGDDYAAMREALTRRCMRIVTGEYPAPDLLVIDGGKGQLEAAYEALESLGLANLVAIGLAKKEELIFSRDHAEPIAFSPNDPALLLLQQIRDEAHRFAVTFHRKARSMRDLRSELDAVPGIGPRRRRTLLTKFGSLAGVRRATREELVSAVGTKVADAVLAYFSRR